MIYKLKSLSTFPPGGWEFFQPETGWRIPRPMEVNYTSAVQQIIDHRKSHPAIGLSLDPVMVGTQLQNSICHRIRFDINYCEPADEEAKKKAQPVTLLSRVRKAVGHAVDELRQTAAGVRVLSEWLGDGGNPVPRHIAIRRSEVCATCPQNIQSRKRVGLVVAEAIREHDGAKQHLDLSTPNDAKLRTCQVCGCHLKLKVWVPLKFIQQTNDKDKFPPHCWIVQEAHPKKTIRFRRRAAFGDVIQSTALAAKLRENGVESIFECDAAIAPSLVDHPDLLEIAPVTVEHITANPVVDLNLDATYEVDPERSKFHIKDLFLKAANPQLQRLGIKPLDSMNWMPKMPVQKEAVEEVLKLMSLFPKPWIVICPKSNAWYNRQVMFEVWARVRPLVPGTMFWTGTDHCESPIVDLGCRDFSRAVAAISLADVVASVDTGSLHVAVALKKPVAAIPGPFRIDLRLTDQMDWTLMRSTLSCIGCDRYSCPIEGRKTNPPCTTPEPELIAAAIHNRILGLQPGRVSAIIPVFNPDIERLRRCIIAVKDQVDEVVVAIDGPDLPNLRLILGNDMMSVKIIQNPGGENRGYGKTCNRAARQSTGSLLLMLNDDCFLNQNAVAQMKEQMLADVAVVGALLRYPDGSIQHGGTTPIDRLNWGHLDHRQQVPSITSPVDMEFVTFAAALVRRTAFYQVGCFDERFFCYNEDSDLCLSLRRAGWRVRYNPMATGIHQESQSTGANGKKLEMLRHGQRMMEEKWKAIL